MLLWYILIYISMYIMNIATVWNKKIYNICMEHLTRTDVIIMFFNCWCIKTSTYFIPMIYVMFACILKKRFLIVFIGNKFCGIYDFVFIESIWQKYITNQLLANQPIRSIEKAILFGSPAMFETKKAMCLVNWNIFLISIFLLNLH